MKLVKLKCEGCGAILKVNEELKKVTCNYCGTEFFVDDGSTKHTYRKIDEARIKEAEVSEKIKLKELELEEKKIKSKEKSKEFKIKISIVLVIIMIIGWFLGDASGDDDSAFYMISLISMLIITYMWMWGEISENNKK